MAVTKHCDKCPWECLEAEAAKMPACYVFELDCNEQSMD